MASPFVTESYSMRGHVLFVAVVHAPDAVCFAAAAPTRLELVEQIAEYVRRHADEQLWPAGASEVRRLLDGGEPEAAIERYFALVGQRWDDEWLVTAAIDGRATPDTSAQLDGVALPPLTEGIRVG